MHGCKLAGVELDRKILADLAMNEAVRLAPSSRRRRRRCLRQRNSQLRFMRKRAWAAVLPFAPICLWAIRTMTMTDIATLQTETLAAVTGADSLDALEAVRVARWANRATYPRC
jgi:hypothetical protein